MRTIITADHGRLPQQKMILSWPTGGYPTGDHPTINYPTVDHTACERSPGDYFLDSLSPILLDLNNQRNKPRGESSLGPASCMGECTAKRGDHC